VETQADAREGLGVVEFEMIRPVQTHRNRVPKRIYREWQEQYFNSP
jgi:hypothetical protein